MIFDIPRHRHQEQSRRLGRRHLCCPLLNLVLHGIPYPRLSQIPNLGSFGLLLLLLVRPHLLHAKLGQRSQVVPPARLVLRYRTLGIPHVIDDSEPSLCGTQVSQLHGAVAGFRNGAHGREGELGGRGEGAVDEALEGWAAGARGWGEVNVDLGGEG